MNDPIVANLDSIDDHELALVGPKAASLVRLSRLGLAVSPGFPVSVGQSKQLSYHDHGMDWELTGKNSFQAPFDYAGP